MVSYERYADRSDPETEGRRVVSRGRGGAAMGSWSLMGAEFTCRKMKRALETDGVCTAMCVYSTPLNGTRQQAKR